MNVQVSKFRLCAELNLIAVKCGQCMKVLLKQKHNKQGIALTRRNTTG